MTEHWNHFVDQYFLQVSRPWNHEFKCQQLNGSCNVSESTI